MAVSLLCFIILSLFMIHEFDEIIFTRPWIEQNQADKCYQKELFIARKESYPSAESLAFMIAEEFAKGAEKEGKILGKDLFIILDREEAIQKAIDLAKKDDIVLVLGKGHEKTILRAEGAVPFEDLKVTRKILKKKMQK